MLDDTSKQQLTDAESYWLGHVQRQPASGLSVRQYCEREGFSQPSFYNWRRRLSASATGATASVSPFLEIGSLAQPPGEWEMEITLPSGATLRLARGFSPDSLRRALQVLGSCRGSGVRCASGSISLRPT